MATRRDNGIGVPNQAAMDGFQPRSEPFFGGPSQEGNPLAGMDMTSFAWKSLFGQPEIDTWTPVSSAEVNCATTMNESMYIDFGPGVLCFGRVSIDAVLTATATSFEMSLPVDTEFANVGQLSGIAVNGNVASLTARILGNTANATAEVNFVSSDINDRVFSFFFAYMKNKG